MKINDALAGATLLGLDTDVVIHFVEARPPFAEKMQIIFGHIAQGTPRAIVSTITLLEGMVKPLQVNDVRLQAGFRSLLLATTNVETLSVDAEIAERAAELRARYRMKTPDAVQAATALVAGCDAFLTNNGTDFRRVTELTVLVLDELEI